MLSRAKWWRVKPTRRDNRADLLMTLGFAGILFLSLTVVVADQVGKAAHVRLLGIETTGNENLMLKPYYERET